MKHYIVEPFDQTFGVLCGDCEALVRLTDIKYAKDIQRTAENAVHIATQDLVAHILKQELDDLLAHWSRNLGPIDQMAELEDFWSVLARAAIKSFGKAFASAYLSELCSHIEYDDRYQGFIDRDQITVGQATLENLFNAIEKGPPFRNDGQDAHGCEATKPDMRVVEDEKSET